MSERYVCTKEAPWDKSKGERATHPDAKDDGECQDGCCDYFLCPHCKLRFRVEAAQ